MSIQCETVAQQAAGAELGFFERWLTLWVFLSILAGIAAGQLAAGPVHLLGDLEIAQVNLPGRAAHLGDDHPDADEDRLRRPASGAAALAGHRRHPLRQLGGQAVLHGTARLAFLRGAYSRPICRPSRSTATSRASSCWPRRPARRWSSSGARLSDGEPLLHPVPGRVERQHHGFRFRAYRRAASGHVVHHGAVGHAVHLRGSLYRHSGDPRAALAQVAAGQGRGAVPRACWRRCTLVGSRRCCSHWCCCSRSRAKPSCGSR